MGDSGKGALAFLIVIVVVFILAFRGCSSSVDNSVTYATAYVSESPSPSFDKPEQPLPENGSIMRSAYRPRVIQLTIVTPAKDYYMLKLKNRETGETMVQWFVYPDSRIQTTVPGGTYVMQYAVGTAWYGEDDLFGPDTLYGQFTNDFEFESNYTYTLELIPQLNGNLGEKAIGAEDFK